MTAFEIRDVGKVFVSNNRACEALKSINLSIVQNEFVCIIGQSGCGKTTLLKIMAGFEKATTGRVLCNGSEMVSPRMVCAFVFQGFDQLLPWKTVKQNVIYPLFLSGYGNKKMCSDKADAFLAMAGIENPDIKNRYPNMLSGGEKQRAAIARALAMQPKIILMDEPFSSLDDRIRELLHNNLLSVWRNMDITVVFITHNIEEAIHLSTRVIILKKSKGVVLDVQNPVAGNKTPTDDGYVHFWQQLRDKI
ncbi:nitrate ABC transporter ATP-binding protein [Spirochaetia bacterium]|nr:nitrate ABC transporter ATP-binding protein [Spirochaetia bacterium]